jgi:hypothetical protein
VVVLFNPSSDKNIVQAALIADSEILSLMELSDATAVEIAKHIIKRKQWQDLATNERRINIYFRPSSDSRNGIISGETLEIDAHVPAEYDYIADDIIKRIKLVLHKKNVSNRHLKFIGQLGELPTIPGFYCAGIRFNYFITL